MSARLTLDEARAMLVEQKAAQVLCVGFTSDPDLTAACYREGIPELSRSVQPDREGHAVRLSAAGLRQLSAYAQERGVRVMGIDPGLTRTGYGIVESEGSALRALTAGTARAEPGLSVSQQLFVALECLRHAELAGSRLGAPRHRVTDRGHAQPVLHVRHGAVGENPPQRDAAGAKHRKANRLRHGSFLPDQTGCEAGSGAGLAACSPAAPAIPSGATV